MKRNNLQGQVVALETEKLHLENEIERLNKERNKTYENGLNYFLELQEKKEEIERLHSIIKEVREYIEENTEEKKSWLNGIPDYTVFKGNIEQVLDILDKGE